MADTPSRIIERRRFLGLAGLGTAGVLAASSGLGGLTRPARAAAAPDALAAPDAAAGSVPPALRFAVVTDTHASPEEPARLQLLPRVFQSIERANPDFVMNCGDITDYGAGAEFDAYLSTIPASLRPRMRHVPGNHEMRWDVNAGQLYARTFGPAPYTFDAGGLRLVGLDPTQLLQEPGHFGPEKLRWLAGAIGGPAPAVLFQHFPYGADHYYVNDQDAFFETVTGTPVRAVFAGHVHAEGVYRFDGFTQVTGAATRNAAVYHWVERADDAGHPVLRVWVVTVALDGVEVRRELTTIPLGGAGRSLAPGRVVIDLASGGALDVRVEVPREAAPAQVRAQLYPQHVFGGRNAGAWVALAAPGRSRWWSGTVDAAALPPGTHRLQLRVAGADGTTHESTASFSLPAVAGTPGRRWSRSLSGSVQGGLTATADGLVVAASTGGDVVLVDPRRDGRARWTASAGPVLRAPAVTADTVIVPSADHRLYALDAGDGTQRWSVDAGAPVLSAPLVTALGADATAAVVFAAGRTLYAVAAADGAELWRADLGGFFAGRAACDGTRVYAGSGDGYAYAFDAATGERLWAFSTTSRTNTYGRLLYGAWDDTVELLPGGLVLIATVASTYALDAATGQVRWHVASGCMYPQSGLSPHGLLLFDEWGRFQLVDPATGTRRWYAELGARTLNAGPVIAGSTAWVVATTGLLAGVDVATGAIAHRLQTGPANTFSTPAVVVDILVFGDQDGGLHGIDLP